MATYTRFVGNNNPNQGAATAAPTVSLVGGAASALPYATKNQEKTAGQMLAQSVLLTTGIEVRKGITSAPTPTPGLR